MLDPVTIIAILAAVGLGAGTIGSMLGVGGGIIMVPALAFLGLPPGQIAGTSLFAVASTSVSSTAAYSRQKRIDYRHGLEMAAAAVPGGVLGAFLSKDLALPDFKLYFGILLMAVGTYIAFRESILKEKKDDVGGKVTATQHAAIFAIAFGAGIISSLFGVGGGVIFVPVLLLMHRMTMHSAAPTSQLTLMVTSIAGLATHVTLGHVDYLYAIALSAGAVIGAQLGARWSRSVKNRILQKALAAVLVAVAVKFVADWLTAAR